MSEPLRLHRLAWRVRNLGAGERLALWTQGCRIGCPGCCSVNSQDLSGGTVRPVHQWLQVIEDVVGGAVPSGLTISGGEPTLQALAVSELIAALRSRYPALDVLLYSGLPWLSLKEEYPALVAQCDLVISEPYLAGVAPLSPLHGSGNQKLHLLTPLAKRRYLSGARCAQPQGLTVSSVTGGQMAAIGIPTGIEALAAMLERRGIRLEQPSWRS